MGYFANGSEAERYEDKVCAHCIHWGGEGGDLCPVWFLHLLCNYEQEDEDKEDLTIFLDSLIPRAGTANLLCTMFIPSDDLGEYVKENWDKFEKARTLDAQPQMPQPDWSSAPEWAIFAVVEGNYGAWWWYGQEPVLEYIKEIGWSWSPVGLWDVGPMVDLPLGIDWRLSLSKRPEKEDG